MPNHVTNMVMSSPEVIAQLLDEQERPDFTQVCPYPEKLSPSGDGINLLIEETVRTVLSTINELPADDPALLKDYFTKRVGVLYPDNHMVVNESHVEQFRVFKSICMLYCYRDIIKHNGISTIYTDTVNGVTYQVMSSKFNTITNLLLPSGVNKLR